MITILLLIIITALVSNGVNLITQKGKIGYFMRAWYDGKIKEWEVRATTCTVMHEFKEENQLRRAIKILVLIMDPLLICPTCMASVYVSLISIGYILLFTTDLKMWVMWPLVVLGSACLNTIVQKWAK